MSIKETNLCKYGVVAYPTNWWLVPQRKCTAINSNIYLQILNLSGLKEILNWDLKNVSNKQLAWRKLNQTRMLIWNAQCPCYEPLTALQYYAVGYDSGEYSGTGPVVRHRFETRWGKTGHVPSPTDFDLKSIPRHLNLQAISGASNESADPLQPLHKTNIFSKWTGIISIIRGQALATLFIHHLICSRKSLQKLPQPEIFHSVWAGYWL